MNAIAPPSGYRIQQAMSAAMAFREQMCADLDNTDDEALLLALDSETDALDLLRLVLRSVAEAKSFAAATGERIKDLQARKARFEAQEATRRLMAHAIIKALELPGNRFVDPEVTASIGMTKQKIAIPDPTKLPEEFREDVSIITIVPLMDKIAAAVAADEIPAGVDLIPGRPTITIRSK